MDFAFSPEQEELREWARRFLAERYGPGRVAEIADGAAGYDPDAWPLIAELGWLDEGLSFLDEAVLFEECGAVLLPAPFFATRALAQPALRGDAELHGSVCRGERRATLAWAEPGVPQGLLDHGHTATRVVEGGRLQGHKVLVPDAAAA
ncbi:MAG: acyl-CoA dehydrogenase family protein, partial [Streptomycetales bacterium]